MIFCTSGGRSFQVSLFMVMTGVPMQPKSMSTYCFDTSFSLNAQIGSVNITQPSYTPVCIEV